MKVEKKSGCVCVSRRPSWRVTWNQVRLCSTAGTTGWPVSGLWSARRRSPAAFETALSLSSGARTSAWWCPSRRSPLSACQRSTLTPNPTSLSCGYNQRPRCRGFYRSCLFLLVFFFFYGSIYHTHFFFLLRLRNVILDLDRNMNDHMYIWREKKWCSASDKPESRLDGNVETFKVANFRFDWMDWIWRSWTSLKWPKSIHTSRLVFGVAVQSPVTASAHVRDSCPSCPRTKLDRFSSGEKKQKTKVIYDHWNRVFMSPGQGCILPPPGGHWIELLSDERFVDANTLYLFVSTQTVCMYVCTVDMFTRIVTFLK